MADEHETIAMLEHGTIAMLLYDLVATKKLSVEYGSTIFVCDLRKSLVLASGHDLGEVLRRAYEVTTSKPAGRSGEV